MPACLLTICFLLCGNQQPGKAGAGGGGASAARRFGIICGQPDGPFQALAGAPARPHGPVENDLEMSQAPIPQQPALMIEGKKHYILPWLESYDSKRTYRTDGPIIKILIHRDAIS